MSVISTPSRSARRWVITLVQPIKDELAKYCPVSRALSAGGHGAKITENWDVTYV
jgi:hypothetical protein